MNKHIGSSLDDFLESEGVRDEFEASARKRVEDWLTTPVFEVKVGEKHYKIWASGMTEGFADGDTPVLIINRIQRFS